MDLPAECALARRVVRLAARHIDALAAGIPARDDAPHDISTRADREAQRLILEEIGRARPGARFLAEEKMGGARPGAAAAGSFWVVDPIDGTRGFVAKNGEWSVLVALVEGGTPAVAVAALPAEGRLAWAVRGAGAFEEALGAEGEGRLPLRVAGTETLAAAHLLVSRGWSEARAEETRRLADAGRVSRSYSAGVKCVRVARGEAEAYFGGARPFHPWDVCAGELIVREAGGRVTDLAGEAPRYDAAGTQIAGLLATNGRLHEALRRRLSGGED